jgi:hypothetical protein
VVQNAVEAIDQLMRNWSAAARTRLGTKSPICQSSKWKRTPYVTTMTASTGTRPTKVKLFQTMFSAIA